MTKTATELQRGDRLTKIVRTGDAISLTVTKTHLYRYTALGGPRRPDGLPPKVPSTLIWFEGEPRSVCVANTEQFEVEQNTP
jgi:hypothetical protein